MQQKRRQKHPTTVTDSKILMTLSPSRSLEFFNKNITLLKEEARAREKERERENESNYQKKANGTTSDGCQ